MIFNINATNSGSLESGGGFNLDDHAYRRMTTFLYDLTLSPAELLFKAFCDYSQGNAKNPLNNKAKHDLKKISITGYRLLSVFLRDHMKMLKEFGSLYIEHKDTTKEQGVSLCLWRKQFYHSSNLLPQTSHYFYGMPSGIPKFSERKEMMD